MKRIAEFIFDHQYDIEYITEAETLIERGDISLKVQPVLRVIEEQEAVYEKYPVEEQAKQRELQSGKLLCKSWGPDPFWVIYGKVDHPQFLKERKYIENIMNSLYRDNNGHGYMLIPLYDFSSGFSERVYREAWDMGVREHPSYFIPYCYPMNVSDIKETAQSFTEFYSLDELIERFQHVITKILCMANLVNLEVTWKANGISVNSKALPNENLVKIANALMIAIKMHYGAVKRAFIGQVVTRDTLLVFAKGRISLKKVS